MKEMAFIEKTFIIIKPSAIRRGLMGDIIKRFEQRGLKIVAMNMKKISAEHAEKHYVEHANKFFFDSIINGLTSGPVVALVVEGVNAIGNARKIVGATNPSEALPGTIRGDFAHSQIGTKNLVHASASKSDAEKEIELWFSPDDINSYSRNDETDVFLTE